MVRLGADTQQTAKTLGTFGHTGESEVSVGSARRMCGVETYTVVFDPQLNNFGTRIEVHAKLPRGRGTWPAIWMLPSKTPMEWPDDGEIDIMEHVGHNPGQIHASLHSKNIII